MEGQIRGAILKVLKEVGGSLSLGYLKVLLIYKGFIVQDKTFLLKETTYLAERGYIEFENPVAIKGFEDAQRIKLTAKGYALLDGQIVDNEIQLEGV